MQHFSTTSKNPKSTYLEHRPACSCGSRDFITQRKAVHLGLYCGTCGRWQRWIAQNNPIVSMPFGKYRGTPITDLPDAYLNWILENIELKKAIYDVLNGEFERRGAKEKAAGDQASGLKNRETLYA